MNSLDNSVTRSHPKEVRLLLILVAVTVALSLLFAAQVYVGGPVRLSVVSELYDLSLSPTEPLVAAGAQDGTVRLWDMDNDWAMRKLSGHDGAVVGVGFLSDGSTLVSAGHDGKVRLWDVTSGDELRSLTGHTEWGTSVAFSPDGAVLASGANENTVRLWGLAP